MKRQLLITIAALTLLAPGVLLAQSDLTLEDLAAQLENLTSKVTDLFTAQAELNTANDELAQRLAAIETAIAPTPTPTPTATHTPTLVPSPTTPPERAYLTVQRRMNVRRGPGTHREILGTAEAGAEFDITGKNINEDWWQIEYEGDPGWVYAPYVTANHADEIQVVSTPTPIPTPTLRPTNTPTPAPTPTWTPTPDVRREQAYRAEIARILGGDWGIATMFGIIGELLTQAGETPILMFNDTWKMQLAVALTTLKTFYQEAQDLSPPDNLRSFHDLFVDALSYCDAFVDKYVEGLDNFDVEAIESGSALMALCGQKLELATQDPNW